MPDGSITVFLVAAPGTETRSLADSLGTCSKLAIATLGSGSLAHLVRSVPGGRFVFVANSQDEGVPDALDRLVPRVWCRVDRDRLLADPRTELQKLCEFLGIDYD